MNNKSVLKKYETIVSNIEWHIKTNEPTEEEIEKLNAQLDIYREVIHDFSWLNEVRWNEELKAKFIEVINEEFGNLVMTPLANKCIEIAKQYSDSKLSELEKWIDENRMKNEFEDSVYYPELKTKIQSLK